MPAWNHIRKRSRQPTLTAPHLRNVLSAGGRFLPSPKKPHSGKTTYQALSHLRCEEPDLSDRPKMTRLGDIEWDSGRATAAFRGGAATGGIRKMPTSWSGPRCL